MNKFEEYLNEAKDYAATMGKGYTGTSLSKINPRAETVNIQVSDYDGNKTKFLGVNDKEACMALIKFAEIRMKNLKNKGTTNPIEV